MDESGIGHSRQATDGRFELPTPLGPEFALLMISTTNSKAEF